MQLTKVVPFLVEDELLRLGAIFEKMRTGSLSPSLMAVSSLARTPHRPRAAQALVKLLGERAAHALLELTIPSVRRCYRCRRPRRFRRLGREGPTRRGAAARSELRSIVDRAICAASIEGGRMSNEKIGSAAGASRALQPTETNSRFLCPTKFLSTLRMAHRYHWTRPRRLFTRRWQRRRSGIGR